MDAVRRHSLTQQARETPRVGSCAVLGRLLWKQNLNKHLFGVLRPRSVHMDANVDTNVDTNSANADVTPAIIFSYTW